MLDDGSLRHVRHNFIRHDDAIGGFRRVFGAGFQTVALGGIEHMVITEQRYFVRLARFLT